MSAKGRLEDRGVARHGKLLERLARRAGEGVEGVGFAVFTQHIVKKCAELRVA